MVGEHDHRLAVRGHLHGATNQALGGELAPAPGGDALEPRTAQAHADSRHRVGDLPRRRDERRPRLVAEPVAPRSGEQPEPLGHRLGRREHRVDRGAWVGAGGEHGADGGRRRPDAGEAVPAARAERRRRRDAAADGQGAPTARRGRGSTRISSPGGERRSPRHCSTSATTDGPQRAQRRAHRSSRPRPPPVGLPSRRLRARRRDPSTAPDGDTPRWANPGRPPSCTDVDHPAAMTSRAPSGDRRAGEAARSAPCRWRARRRRRRVPGGSARACRAGASPGRPVARPTARGRCGRAGATRRARPSGTRRCSGRRWRPSPPERRGAACRAAAGRGRGRGRRGRRTRARTHRTRRGR